MRHKMFLSIYLPTIFVDVFLKSKKRTAEQQEKPFVMAAITIKGEKYVARCSKELMSFASKDRAIKPGMKLAHARALFPEAEICEYSESKERRYLEELAFRAYRYSPICGLDRWPTDSSVVFSHRFVGINLDISGSEKLFGGYDKFLALLDESLASLGLFARLSISPTLGSAWAFSRYLSRRCSFVVKNNLRQELSSLPIQSLRFTRHVEDLLMQVNIKTVGELLQLSRRSLVTRFGDEAVRRIDQALGAEEEPIVPVAIRRSLRLAHDFLQPVADLEVVKNISSSLLGSLQDSLESKARVLSRFMFSLDRDGGARVEKEFFIQFPSSSRTQTHKRLMAYLEKVDLCRGALKLQILVVESEPRKGANISFAPRFSNANIPVKDDAVEMEQQGELIDRLRDHLGSSRLMELQYRSSYFPERSFEYVPYSSNSIRVARAGTVSIPPEEHVGAISFVPGSRPSVLFSEPEEIRAIAVIPDSVPVQVTWRNRIYRILTGTGPERISGEWWLVKECISASRDYFKVQIDNGVWIWIFRELDKGKWYVHGVWQ